ncbi:MAG: putative transcriptional regulator [Phenylobacterium sp.]|jgi:putative transcriptional regulator
MMNEEMFNELLASVEEVDAIIAGDKKPSREFHFDEPQVKAIREKTGLTQNRFALMIGVSKRTLENWEQGRRQPTGPARALLKLVDADPEYALKSLYG